MLEYPSCQGTASEYPGVAKFGIALEWGSRGRWFESSHSDQTQESVAPAFFCFVKSSRFEPIKCRSPVDFCQTPARRCLLHSVLESSHSDQTQESVAPAFSCFVKSSRFEPIGWGCLKIAKCPKRTTVIANQSADWCGNPPDFQTSMLENSGFYFYPGDCHTSDSVTGSQ